jgi:hypothetical protein
LVIDISRLRETRANSENENELTVIRPASVAASAAPQPAMQPREQFPRISLPLSARGNKRKLFAIIAVAAVLLIAVGMIAQRFRQAAPPEAATLASPTPTETPTPSPSPSPVAQAKAPVKKPTPAPKKKGNAIFNKMKKIFKNPF